MPENDCHRSCPLPIPTLIPLPSLPSPTVCPHLWLTWPQQMVAVWAQVIALLALLHSLSHFQLQLSLISRLRGSCGGVSRVPLTPGGECWLQVCNWSPLFTQQQCDLRGRPAAFAPTPQGLTWFPLLWRGLVSGIAEILIYTFFSLLLSIHEHALK